MRKLIIITLCIIPLILQAKVYNVKDYGAKADGINIDSQSINSAIEDAAKNGGGTVYLPSGDYSCYSIRLASHINLYLEQGARIIAAFPTEEQGFDNAENNEHNKFQDFGHSHWKNSLIWGINLEDITIFFLHIVIKTISNKIVFIFFSKYFLVIRSFLFFSVGIVKIKHRVKFIKPCFLCL